LKISIDLAELSFGSGALAIWKHTRQVDELLTVYAPGVTIKAWPDGVSVDREDEVDHKRLLPSLQAD
jgi:hypothetical protein